MNVSKNENGLFVFRHFSAEGESFSTNADAREKFDDLVKPYRSNVSILSK